MRVRHPGEVVPMPVLNVVNKSPFEKSSLDSCVRTLGSGGALILIEDGVYAAVKGGHFESLIDTALRSGPVYALDSDLVMRGIDSTRIAADVQRVDYAGFVDLCVHYEKVHSWL